MILIYTLLLLLLGMLKLLVSLRARALERKYTRVAATVDQLVHQPEYKLGNSGRYDQCSTAKRTFLLGLLVQKRDRLEAKHYAWERWADRLNRWINTVRTWKGKKLPYTLGALDVWLLLYLIDYFSVGQFVSARNLIEMVSALFSN